MGHISESLSLNIVEEPLNRHRVNIVVVDMGKFRDELGSGRDDRLPKYCDLLVHRELSFNIARGLRGFRAGFGACTWCKLGKLDVQNVLRYDNLLRVT